MTQLLYKSPDFGINDSWYAYHNSTYYAYYLTHADRGWSGQGIACSTSRDLLHWDYFGMILEKNPDGWDNTGLATGSVVEYNGRWYMLYTGNGDRPDRSDGIGLAVSDDLLHWERVGDAPVLPRRDPYTLPSAEGDVPCRLLADPYITPNPIDGLYYVYINSYALDMPFGQRGCQAVFRTRDMINYEPCDIALKEPYYDRIETAQMFAYKDKYFLYFGGVHPTDPIGQIEEWYGMPKNVCNENCIYISDHPTHGFVSHEGSKLDIPFNPPVYICKIIEHEGELKLIANAPPAGCIGPYTFDYIDGKITVK